MITLNSPLNINQSITLKNRVVVPPMASQTADTNGFVTEKTLSHYQRLCQARTGPVMVEYSYVHRSGKSEANQLAIDGDEKLEGLKNVSDLIHQAGAYSAMQITHAGAKTFRQYTEGKLIAPSGVTVPSKDQHYETPDVATIDDITLIKSSFVQAARRASIAGFDIVELHCAHGYGLNQWISPITNQRKDEYGGNLSNRARIVLEIIAEIRMQCPELTLSARIPGMDHFDNGLNYTQTTSLAAMLVKSGVSIINVSSGIGGWRRPRNRAGEGYLVDDSRVIQSGLNAPVIGVGGIKSAAYINDSLQDKRFTLAAVGRAILNDPQWGPSVGLN